jgi:hypothetical protein
MGIDYRLLYHSTLEYEGWGFRRIEAPWAVTREIDAITKPDMKTPFVLKHNNKHLVASGEQSFLYLYLKGFLPKGQFQTITPCFREEEFDFLHTKYFIKNELIKTDSVTDRDLQMVIDMCLEWYRTLIPEAEAVKTDDGWDIEIHGKELGSYGIRSCEFLDWIYATGCAEPRTSSLMKLYGLPQNEYPEGIVGAIF